MSAEAMQRSLDVYNILTEIDTLDRTHLRTHLDPKDFPSFPAMLRATIQANEDYQIARQRLTGKLEMRCRLNLMYAPN